MIIELETDRLKPVGSIGKVKGEVARFRSRAYPGCMSALDSEDEYLPDAVFQGRACHYDVICFVYSDTAGLY